MHYLLLWMYLNHLLDKSNLSFYFICSETWNLYVTLCISFIYPDWYFITVVMKFLSATPDSCLLKFKRISSIFTQQVWVIVGLVEDRMSQLRVWLCPQLKVKNEQKGHQNKSLKCFYNKSEEDVRIKCFFVLKTNFLYEMRSLRPGNLFIFIFSCSSVTEAAVCFIIAIIVQLCVVPGV